MPKVFICYRREDSAYPAHQIYGVLSNHFGSESVVFDVDTIPLGVDFREYLNKQVSKCDILLAVIGDKWIEILKQRLDDPTDFVRIEIQAALKRKIPVVPILVGNASMLIEKNLPQDIKGLAYKQAAEVRAGPHLKTHLQSLIEGIKHLLAELKAEEDSKQKEAEEERKRKEEEAKWKAEKERALKESEEERKRKEADDRLKVEEQPKTSDNKQEHLEVPHSPPPIAEQMIENAAITTQHPDESYHSRLVEQRSSFSTESYAVLGLAIALVAGLLMGTNIAVYFRGIGWKNTFAEFFAMSLPFCFGLCLTLVIANLISHRDNSKKVLIKVGAIVAVEFSVYIVVINSAPLGDLPILMFGWIGISVFVVIAISALKIHRKNPPRTIFFQSVITGAIGGVLFAIVLFFLGWIGSLNAWMVEFANGTLIGALIGFIESFRPNARRNGLVKDHLTRSSS
jgi:hypothetical protein